MEYHLILSFFITLSIYSLLVHSIGSILTIYHPVKESHLLNTVINQIVGLSFLIIAYSIIKSEGKTILVVFIFILIAFFKKNNGKKTFNINSFLHQLFWVIIFYSFFFILSFLCIYDFQNNAFKPIYNDFFLYATFSDSLKLWGSEHIFTSVSYFFNDFRNGVMPYHFPELWLTAFVSEVFNCPTVTSYLLITSSVITGLFAMAIACIFEPIVKNKVLLFLVAIALTYLSGFYIPIYNSLAGTDIEWYSWVSISGYSGIKFAFSYIFIILSFIVFTKYNWLGGLVLFSFVPFVSVGLLPGIWGGLSLYALGIILINRFKNSKEYIILMIVISLEATYYFLFYRFFGISYTDKYASSLIISKILPPANDLFVSYKNLVANGLMYWGRTYLFYIPFLLPLLVTGSLNKKLFILCSLCLLSGAMTTAITYGLTDSGQFVSNIGVCFIVLIITGIPALMEKTFKEKKILQIISFIGIVIVSVYSFAYTIQHKNYSLVNKPDMAFVEKVSEQFEENKPEPVMVFYNKQYYMESISIRDAYGALDDELRYIHAIKNIPIVPVMANVEEYTNNKPLTYADSFYLSELTPLNRWLKNNPGKTIIDFVKKYKIIHFYFMNGTTIPDFVKKNKISEIESSIYKSKYFRISEIQ